MIISLSINERGGGISVILIDSIEAQLQEEWLEDLPWKGRISFEYAKSHSQSPETRATLKQLCFAGEMAMAAGTGVAASEAVSGTAATLSKMKKAASAATASKINKVAPKAAAKGQVTRRLNDLISNAKTTTAKSQMTQLVPPQISTLASIAAKKDNDMKRTFGT